MQFLDLGLNPSICSTLIKKGYTTPTAIQVKAIPTILQGSDVMAAAQTGIGKTIAFTVPIIHKLLPKKNRDKKFSQ